ncbi:hypothetical protein TNCV_1637471 [Trichonephila clavipes]|nr:hypothetical protein TNCV_1637471 [Trichonephila clavipes]
MATGSYMTPIYSRSQSEVQGDLHNVTITIAWDHSTQTNENSQSTGRHCTPTTSQNTLHVSRLEPGSQHERPPPMIARRTRIRGSAIVEALSTSPPTNKSILTDEEDNSVVVPSVKRSKRYNPPAMHVMAFILAIPG